MEIISAFNRKGELENNRKGDWQALLLIMGLAFILRIFLVLYPEVIHNDGVEYIRHAKEVLLGNWTAGKSSPGYPALIAFVFTFIKKLRTGWNLGVYGLWGAPRDLCLLFRENNI